jgi:GNAT superfamily N-acetyltransferase
MDTYAGVEERLRRDGVRFASLAELGREDEPFLRALQGLGADASYDRSAAEPPRPSLESWHREVLHAPGMSPETHWVALVGDHPIGMTYLKRLSEDAAENDYTVVATTHRGRGIAPALKLQAIAWARRNGVSWFYTSSEIGNTPMITVNRRLGYRPGVRRREIARDFEG